MMADVSFRSDKKLHATYLSDTQRRGRSRVERILRSESRVATADRRGQPHRALAAYWLLTTQHQILS